MSFDPYENYCPSSDPVEPDECYSSESQIFHSICFNFNLSPQQLVRLVLDEATRNRESEVMRDA